MDYELLRNGYIERRKARVVPCRPENLRKGGGRRDRPGWTEHKRRSNRDRFNALRPFIKTGVTLWYPSKATPEQLEFFSESSRNFCKEKGIPARGVWEGPWPPHLHIALGILQDPILEEKWRRRLKASWQRLFGEPMPQQAFLWKPDEKPDEIASYFLKTRKNGRLVKAEGILWLRFNPVWETGFRAKEKGP